MNKRGIMLDFLVTVLLALLIFIPTCYGVSKYFRLSSQAVDNFKTMAADIEDLAKNGQDGERRSAVVILDAGSFMALFARSENVIFAQTRETEPRGRDEPASFVVTSWEVGAPPACTGYPCFCLCREFSEGETSRITIEGTTASSIETPCTNWNCRVLEGVGVAASWGVVRLNDKDVRRKAITLEKGGGQIRVLEEAQRVG